MGFRMIDLLALFRENEPLSWLVSRSRFKEVRTLGGEDVEVPKAAPNTTVELHHLPLVFCRCSGEAAITRIVPGTLSTYEISEGQLNNVREERELETGRY